MVSRLRNLLEVGWLEMPYDVPRYNGTGGPGNFLEDMLGLTAGCKDIPDCIGWEVKWCSPQTALITLFHKEADDSKIMRYMVSKYGWRDAEGRLSFRHPNDDDKDDGYELYLTILPDQYPMHFLQRLNYAWSVLTTGRRRHVDDMVFERETVVGFAERLLSIAGKMKSRGRPHFHSPLSPT